MGVRFAEEAWRFCAESVTVGIGSEAPTHGLHVFQVERYDWARKITFCVVAVALSNPAEHRPSPVIHDHGRSAKVDHPPRFLCRLTR